MYRLAQPAAELASLIEHYWAVEREGEEVVDLRVDVYVDARADLVFNFGAPYTRTILGQAPTSIGSSNVDAQRTKPIVIEHAGDVSIIGVRFRVGGIAPFADVAIGVITDTSPPPVEVFGETALELENALCAAAGRLSDQAELLDSFFVQRLRADPSRDRFDRARRMLEADPGVRLRTLAAELATTERTIGRDFYRYLGIAPNLYRRIARFQRALSMMMSDPGTTLAEVAAICGYYDQAHLVRAFHQFAGGVPRSYRGYYPQEGPDDFAPNVVRFVQDAPDTTP